MKKQRDKIVMNVFGVTELDFKTRSKEFTYLDLVMRGQDIFDYCSEIWRVIDHDHQNEANKKILKLSAEVRALKRKLGET